MNSAIILTKYIYPLEKEILISEELGIKFDNPRTEKEIELIKNFIFPSLKFENEISLSKKIVPLPLRTMLNLDYLKKYLDSNPLDEYAKQFICNDKDLSYLDLVAKSWIIIRFDTNFDLNKILNSKQYIGILSLNENERKEYSNNINDIFSYCQVHSLLSYYQEEEPYFGHSYLWTLTHPFELFFPAVNENIIEILNSFADNLSLLNEKLDGSLRFATFWWLNDREKLLSNASKLESLLQIKVGKNQGKQLPPKDKILHIGNRLKIAHEHINQPELSFLLLVGNIEYILTRNPDTSRFNVEDSISRQFKLKTGVALNSADPNFSLINLKSKLKDIYDLRSKIAHGDKVEIERDALFMRVLELYKYTALIITTYINNKPLIDYLKDN